MWVYLCTVIMIFYRRQGKISWLQNFARSNDKTSNREVNIMARLPPISSGGSDDRGIRKLNSQHPSMTDLLCPRLYFVLNWWQLITISCDNRKCSDKSRCGEMFQLVGTSTRCHKCKWQFFQLNFLEKKKQGKSEGFDSYDQPSNFA